MPPSPEYGHGLPENRTHVMSNVPQNSDGWIFFPRNPAEKSSSALRANRHCAK